MFCFNIPLCNPTEAADIISFFQVQCLCRADLLFLFSGLDIQPQNVKPVFGCFCFVLRWWTSGKITSERLFIAKCCHQEWAAHACSRFAHVLLTLAHALLTVCSRFAHALLTLAEVPFESFSFLLSPYEVPFGSLRGSAHGLLTVCSRFAHSLLTVCSRFAHGLLTVCSRFAHGCSRFARAAHDLLMLCSRFGGLCVYLDEETHKQTMPLFCCSEPCVPKAHSFQAADSLRLIFKSEKKQHATHNPSLKRGCHTPASAWEYVCATFLLGPKDPKST